MSAPLRGEAACGGRRSRGHLAPRSAAAGGLTLGISGGARAPSAACRGYAAPDSSDDPLPHEHDLARHASLPEQLVRLSCLGKRKSLCDEWLDLLLLKQIK